MKYFILAGEASGDFLGGRLAKEILKQDRTAKIYGWGGSHMDSERVHILQHIHTLQFMGFYEIVWRFTQIISLIKKCKNQIQQLHPDVIIFIDFSGFNMRIARWAKLQGFHTVYYVPPKIWATRENRIQGLKKYIDLIIVNFPFIRDYFQEHDVPVSYFGNPLANHIISFKSDPHFKIKHGLNENPIAAILPGSRIQEIKYILPELSRLPTLYPDYNWCISCAPGIDEQLIKKILPNSSPDNMRIIKGSPLDLLSHAHLVCVASGTASLEASLLKVPQIVCYKTHPFNYIVARLLIKVRYISLVNLMVDREAVPELIQRDLNLQNIQKEMERLNDKNYISGLYKDYETIHESLFCKNPSRQTAKKIISLISNQKTSEITS